MSTKQLTIRNLPAEVDQQLRQYATAQSRSLNQVVIQLIAKGLGIDSSKQQSNGIEKLAGSWSQEQFEEFKTNTQIFETIDKELWH